MMGLLVVLLIWKWNRKREQGMGAMTDRQDVRSSVYGVRHPFGEDLISEERYHFLLLFSDLCGCDWLLLLLRLELLRSTTWSGTGKKDLC